MFGYVLPIKNKMNPQDFEAYRAVYCGVCKQLGKSYGVLSRFMLNYDLVLLSVVTDALSGEKGLASTEGCFANPLNKRKTLHKTKGLQLGCDGLIMLSYHKLMDTLEDEKFAKRFVYALAKPFMAHLYRKAVKCHPTLNTQLTTQMQRQRQLEAAGTTCLDAASDPTAKMCQALFVQAGKTSHEKQLLGRLGLFAGQIVYLLDAAEDYDDDAKYNRYNPLLLAGLTKQQAVAAVQQRCNMAAGEIAICYNALPIRQYKTILDNIFFLGIPAGIAAAGIKKNRRPPHGQNNRI